LKYEIFRQIVRINHNCSTYNHFFISADISCVEIADSFSDVLLDGYVVVRGDKIFDSKPAEPVENFQTMLNRSYDRHFKKELRSYVLEAIYKECARPRALGASHNEDRCIDWFDVFSTLEADVRALTPPSSCVYET
jgi:hypothetical protein